MPTRKHGKCLDNAQTVEYTVESAFHLECITPTKVAYLHTPNKFALCTANCCLANASDLALEPSILQR